MALTTLPSAGAKLRASVLSALIGEVREIYAICSADQNVGPSNATLQNVTDITVPVVTNATYAFILDLQYSTNTTADIKLGWTFPTGLTMDYALQAFNAAETWVTSTGIQTTVLGLGGTGISARLSGTIVTASTAGNLQLQAAQNTSTAVATNVSKGTLLRVKQVA